MLKAFFSSGCKTGHKRQVALLFADVLQEQKQADETELSMLRDKVRLLCFYFAL